MNVKLLKFGAEWCGPCGVMDKRLENFDKCELIKYSVEYFMNFLLNRLISIFLDGLIL